MNPANPPPHALPGRGPVTSNTSLEPPTSTQTPIKGRSAKQSPQQATHLSPSPNSTRQNLSYASDGARTSLKHNPSSQENGNLAHGQTKGTRKKGKSNKPGQVQYQSQCDSEYYAVQNMDGTASPQPAGATPVKQVYAGPTFHASPAASALPMPKFFSKSVPSAAPSSGLQARLEAEGDISQSSTPDPEKQTATTAAAATPIKRESSPLDVFFNAHRAEQARKQSLHSPSAPSPLSMRRPSTQSPQLTRTPLTNSTHRSSGIDSPNSGPRPAAGKEMFMMELDGVGDQDPEESDDAPVNVTPFRERLGASDPRRRPSTASHGNHDDDLYRQAQSQALKKLLMTQSDAELNGAPQQRPDNHHTRQVSAPTGLSSSGTRGGASPHPQSQHLRPPGQQDIRSMENDLRRILKLDSFGD